MAFKKNKSKIHTCLNKDLPVVLSKGHRVFVTDTEIFLDNKLNKIPLPQKEDGNGNLVNILPTEILEVL